MSSEEKPSPEQLKRAAKLAENQATLNRQIKDYEDALERITRLYGDVADRTKEVQKLQNEILELEKKSSNIQSQRRKISEEMDEITSDILEKEGKLKDTKGEYIEFVKEELDELKKQLEEKQKLLDSTEKAKQSLNESKRELVEQKKLIQDILETEEAYGKEVRKNLEAAEKRRNTFSGMAKDYAREIPIIGNQLSKLLNFQTELPDMLERVAKAGDNMGGKFGGTISRGAKFLSDKITKMKTATIAASAAIIVTIGYAAKLALEIDNLSKSIAAATGFGDKFADSIERMGMAGMMSGVGFKESAEALKSLTEGLSSFNPNAQATNEYVGLTVARLGKLGVSSASAVKSIDHMQRAMGLTAEQAADMTAQVARLGKEIGITGTKMIEQFNAASGRLAIYGKNNIKVFKELAAQAKATGIEMGTLLSISEKFDKFDSAAGSVAKLNAVLGTQLGTIEMMNATDSERVMMLKQQVQMSVGNFDSLDKYTKQYIAQAMGVKDVAEAQRLLNMSTAEYQKYQKGQKDQADIQKELADATAAIVPTMQKLQIAALKLFMVFSPFINFFSGLIELLDRTWAGMSGLAGGLDSASTAGKVMINVLKVLAIVGMAVAAGFAWPVTAVLALVAGLGALYDILHKPGSLSMAEGMFDKTLGPSLASMGKDAANAKSDLNDLNSEMQNTYAAAHPDGNVLDIQAAASIDTEAIAGGITKIKSALMELSTLKIDGFLAMKTDGSNSSFIMGSEGVIKSISEGKLTVDVKMPDMKMPDVHVKVYIGDRELRDIIRTEAKAVVARAG